MPNASKECHIFLTDLVNGGDVLVAISRPYTDCITTDTVHEIPLGEGNVRVTITVPKLKCALLPILTPDATYIEKAVGGFVAWPKRLVVLETSLSQARRGVSQRFEFISPFLVSPVQQNVDRKVYVRERAKNILRILTNASRGKLFLMPYNSDQHWILAVIDPWDDSVLYFNPLGNEPGHLMIGRCWWEEELKKQRNYDTLIDTARCHIQEGYIECGYFVLAFMREITLTVDGLALLQTKDLYTDAGISLVRQEWATFVM
ncbi:hypothetical protein TIFTF001_041344, partial [Ficus carica]